MIGGDVVNWAQHALFEGAVIWDVCTLAAQHPRWGVPRLHWRLQRDGWLVNYKRVERLYRLEGLAVPRVPRPIAVGPNETWSLDFVSDQLASGRRFRISSKRRYTARADGGTQRSQYCRGTPR